MAEEIYDEEGNVIATLDGGGEQESAHEDDDHEEGGEEASGEEDSRTTSHDDSDDESGDGDDGDGGDDVSERRRTEKRRRRATHKERTDRLRAELAARDQVISQLQEQVDGINRRNFGSELAQLDQSMRQTAEAYQYFKGQVKEATDAADGLRMAEAMEKMQLAQRRFDELNNIKMSHMRQQRQPPPLDPRLVNQATAWMERNKWYDPTGQDEDSEVVLMLDKRLAREGFDPTTEAYWQELQRRVEKKLPHRRKSGNVGARPRSVVSGSGRESSGGNSAGGFVLSAERVQAIKDSGAWDDPKRRSDMIKRFRDFDKQNAKRG